MEVRGQLEARWFYPEWGGSTIDMQKVVLVPRRGCMIWRSVKIFSLPEIEQAFLRRQGHILVALSTADLNASLLMYEFKIYFFNCGC